MLQMCPNHSSPPSMMSSFSGPVLMYMGWPRSTQDFLSPMREWRWVAQVGQWNVMWSPEASGCPQGQAGVSLLPSLWSHWGRGPLFVLIQVYAERAL